MIVEFSISNFRSIRKKVSITFEALDNEFPSQQVSMVTLNDGTTLRVLNTSVILGINGKGKSNVLLALESFLSLITQSESNSDCLHVPIYQPYAFDENSEKQPVEIQLDFISGRNRFLYVIRCTDAGIIFEELSSIESGNNQIIYTCKREIKQKPELVFGEGYRNMALDSTLPSLSPNQLFLKHLCTYKGSKLKEVYETLSAIKVVNAQTSKDIEDNFYLVLERLYKEGKESILQQLKRLIQISDLGIDDFSIIRYDEEKRSMSDGEPKGDIKSTQRQNSYQIITKHGDYLLDIREESRGIKRLLSIGALVLETLQKGSVLVFDDLNTTLHPCLLQFVVNLFHNKDFNKKNAQLLFTSNDYFIMSPCMRADQIWMTECDEKGGSNLFSLQDFQDIPITNDFYMWYMVGRFGEQPHFGDINKVLKD